MSRWLLVLALLANACGSHCKELAADRQAFLHRQGGTAEPHLAVVVPYVLINRLLEPRVAELAPIAAGDFVPGPLGKYAGDVQIAVTRVTIVPAATGHLGVRIEVEARDADKVLLTATIESEPTPEVHPERGTLEVAIRPADLKSVKPRLGPDVAAKLADLLLARVPADQRRFLPRPVAHAAAEKAVDALSGRLLQLLIDSGLLGKIGELSRLSFELPRVPVAGIDLASGETDLEVRIVTSLPVQAGLDPAPIAGGEGVRVRISGGAMAELANWAMATGLAPARYDGKGHPKADGIYYPALGWVPGKRPLKVYAWRFTSPCMRVKIGATPHVQLTGDAFQGGFDDGTVEEVKGGSAAKFGVWWKRLGKDAMKVSRKVAADAHLTVGGVPLHGRATDAHLDESGLVIGLAVE